MTTEATLGLTENAREVLAARYLARDQTGAVSETPEEMFRRVAHSIASVEESGDAAETEERFFHALTHLEFLPNSPTLMNAGTSLGQLAACFVLPVDDSLESIFGAIRDSALIHQSGGGVGYDFSRIRPKGDRVASTGGAASGPVSFMRVFDAGVEAIRQGGRRRGANMGVLSVRHPDVEEFATAKRDPETLANFNLSVTVPDEFLEAARTGAEWELINPRNGAAVSRRDAGELFELIVQCAWETGDPGMIFLDRINRDNPTPDVGAITATNPCGEVPLLPYEACMLGSVNLARFVDGGALDWERLDETVALGVRFLDNCLDASRFPLAQIRRAVQANRKIGLGVMGFADAMIELGVRYDSEEAEALADTIMERISKRATQASRELARKRGPFPNFDVSRPAQAGEPPVRNATRTAIAPTGTISLIAGCSSGIEPLYAIAYRRRALEDRTLIEVNPRFERLARETDCWTEDLRHEVLHRGTVAEIESVPQRLRELFRTAQEIEPEWHIRIQAAFQRHTDNAVSKTINLREDATPADVRRAYELAFDCDCKGITVYREGSKRSQVLEHLDREPGTCPDCGAQLQFVEASAHCRACGYSKTS